MQKIGVREEIEGAPGVNFNGIKRTDFLAEIEAAAADDAAIADLESELKMKRDVRDDKYVGRGRQTLKGRPRRRWFSRLWR